MFPKVTHEPGDGAGVDGLGGECEAGGKVRSEVGGGKDGGGVEEDNVAARARFAGEDFAEDGGVVGGSGAPESFDGGDRDAQGGGVKGGERETVGGDLGNMGRTGDGELVHTAERVGFGVQVGAVDDEGVTDPKQLHRFGDGGDDSGGVDTHDLGAGSGGVGERPEEVEDGADAERPADGHDGLERGVECRGEEKGKAVAAERLRGLSGGEVNGDAEGLEDVGRAARGGDGAVSVLGDHQAGPGGGGSGSGGDEGGGGGDVEAAGGVGAGAAGVDEGFALGVAERDGGGGGAEGIDEAGEFGGGLVAGGEGSEQGRELEVGDFSGKNAAHEGGGFGARERLAGLEYLLDLGGDGHLGKRSISKLVGPGRSGKLRAMRFVRLSVWLWLLVCSGAVALARVTRVEVLSRADVLGGQAFGTAGAYERIVGRVYVSLPVANPHNRGIVDLGNAVNLKDGEVEFSADFIAVKPKDARKGNGTMILENPNRGRGRLVGLVEGGDWDLAHSAGDGWLLRSGYTVVTLGWQWDAPGADALRMTAPVAKENGSTITGLLRGDITLPARRDEIPLGHWNVGNLGGVEYPVAAPDDARNTLTVRESRTASRTAIPRSKWSFAHTENGRLVPSDRFIHLDGGFEPGKIYEYVYVVKDPVVAGGGFALMRDFASYAKHGEGPIAPAVRVLGEGISQNGRFLRDFLYEGFNADEQGRIALDGVLAHVGGAGRGSFNYRFAQPSRDAQPMSSVFFPTDVFPFTDEPERDPVSGATGGLLDRAKAEKVVPKIFFSNTSTEYWGRAAALIHVSADGKADATIAPEVRVYHLTGLQHFTGPYPPARGAGDLLGQQPESPLPIMYFWRAMIRNMDAWVRAGTMPPASSYPRIADGTLVPLKQYALPVIPGLGRPHEASEAFRMDFGPGWQTTRVLTVQPPKVGQPFPVLVPQVDADGNEKDGVRLPELTVPLATYTGWNLRDQSIGAPDQRVSFEGSYVPFPRTAEDRKKTGDPRASVAERYAGREDYMTHYAAAVDGLVRQGWLLEQDRAALMTRAAEEWTAVMGAPSAGKAAGSAAH